MSFLIRKTVILSRRFTTSLALAEKPSIPCWRHDENFAPFDRFMSFTGQKFSGRHPIRNTKLLHAHLLRTTVLENDIFFLNSLVDMYWKSGDTFSALKLFDTVAEPNVISWNIMISGYNRISQFEESWEVFCIMQASGVDPNEITYGSILSACSSMHAPVCGELVYALATKNGFLCNGYVRTGMIVLFAENCSFQKALKIFSDIACRNVVCWNAIICGATKNGENLIALNIFQKMCSKSLMPNSNTLSSVLTACGTLEELEIGKALQGRAIKCGSEDVFVETAILNLYAKCGEMSEAAKKFSQMEVRNVVSWTAIISGFVHKDDSILAFMYFKDMRKVGEEINVYTITNLLTACAKPSMILEAGQIHSLILKLGFHLNAVVGASMINMYSKLEEVRLSAFVFREMGNLKNMATWATMISAFAQNQDSERAIKLFWEMLGESTFRPDKYCTSSVLSIITCKNLGKQIHSYAGKTGLDSDVSVGSSLMTMYSKCGSLDEAYRVFEQIPDKDNVSWASMMSGFVEHGCAVMALQLFREMLLEDGTCDDMIISTGLAACSALCFLQAGKTIHGYALRSWLGGKTVVCDALLTMYAKCGTLDLARRVFDMMPQKDAVSYSSLVSSYAQNGYIKEAFLSFHDVLISNLAIDCFTISSLVRAAAVLSNCHLGSQVHAFIEKMGINWDVSVGSSLVSMYSTCGTIKDCLKAFGQVVIPDLVAWTALIVSYAQHGEGGEAIHAYELMKREGVIPDEVTFVGILTACSRNGMVDEALFYLNSMSKDYGLEPNYRHYSCIVDLLGRAGRLHEAFNFIENMPIKPDAFIWETLLAACKVHGDIEIGKVAAHKIMELGSCDHGAYVSLSNICADVGQWDEVMNIRSSMKGAGIRKEPGWSFL